MENLTLERKNIFISYCHKDVPEEWIDKLAMALGQYGINSIVDIYDLQLGQDLNYFMEQIKKVDKVLILLGKTYKEKANDREGGVGTETQIISNDVYKDVEQTKFIPIVVDKDENGDAYLPYYLESRLYTDFSDDSLFAKNIAELVRQIRNLPKRVKPPVIDPPKSLIQYNTNLGSLIIKDTVQFDDLSTIILKEMENFKCSSDEYEDSKDEAIIMKIEDSREVRDFFVKWLWTAWDNKSVNIEDIVSFLEKAYSVADSYKDTSFYEVQNDGCHFFLQEIIIYIVAILFKKKRFKEISQLIKTTYFPNSYRHYVREGIHLDQFYFYLKSLAQRNERLKLNRKSIHADLLMQRTGIENIDITFEDVRLADDLVLMISEWFYKRTDSYVFWYPVTIVYTRFECEDCLQLKKYLVSNSRFEVIRELFQVESKTDFLKRYNELSTLLKNENRTADFCTIPSICSIVKADELFSKD